MFIRVKNIKKQPYAYKVRNRWTRKGTRQKTAGYLGRVYPLTPQKELTFEEFIDEPLEQYLKNSSSRSIILGLVKFELVKHGFSYKGNNRNILLNKPKSEDNNSTNSVTIRADLAPSILYISDTKKPVVIAMNNDFLCNHTLKRLVGFKSFLSEEECGKEFAKAFISAGIPISPVIFVEIFQKVYSRYGSYVK